MPSPQASIEMMVKAYRDVAQSQPFLPFPDSALPALLALRQSHQTTAESREYIDAQKAMLDQVNRQMEELRSNIEEQLALQAALQKRVKTLEEGLKDRLEKTPEQMAEEHANELIRQKAEYDKETSALMKSLDWFIEEHLGPMLAAEELGGPVVGDLLDIDAEELSAGFNARGKPKKSKSQPDEDRRQRRIDDIWGSGQQEQTGKRKRQGDEAAAAGTEMRELIEQLLNGAMESGGDSSAAYVKLPRESAAARFLVRSKVAEFHPKDAARLRLIDFGRELDS